MAIQPRGTNQAISLPIHYMRGGVKYGKSTAPNQGNNPPTRNVQPALRPQGRSPSPKTTFRTSFALLAPTLRSRYCTHSERRHPALWLCALHAILTLPGRLLHARLRALLLHRRKPSRLSLLDPQPENASAKPSMESCKSGIAKSHYHQLRGRPDAR